VGSPKAHLRVAATFRVPRKIAAGRNF